jgi:hypothetical protein
MGTRGRGVDSAGVGAEVVVVGGAAAVAAAAAVSSVVAMMLMLRIPRRKRAVRNITAVA